MGNNKLSPGDLVIVLGGAVAFIASFLHIFTISATLSGGSGSNSTAWSSGFRPLFALPAIIGLCMALHVLITTFADVRLPHKVGGFSWSQIYVALSTWAMTMTLCFLIGNAGLRVLGVNYSPDRTVGFWLTLVGVIALLVGAIMSARERAPTQ